MSEAEKPLRWGLIGASDIAKTRMIPAINVQPDSKIVSVLSSDLRRGQRYAAENHIDRALSALEDFVSDPELDIVYISTTNDLHYPQAKASLQPESTCSARSRLPCPSKMLGKWLNLPVRRNGCSARTITLAIFAQPLKKVKSAPPGRVHYVAGLHNWDRN